MLDDLSEEQWKRLDTLFSAAMPLSEEERRSFLEREIPDSPALREQLEKMLAHAEDASGRIAGAIGKTAFSAAMQSSWTGKHLGPYRILREIGRGGMGIVFEAERDDDEYRKRVALKVASWWSGSDLARERFHQERQILAEIEHPNVARFLDGGTADGVPYFAMEYVEGEPLTAWSRNRELPLRERIELFRTICGAVEHLHANLIIHRDLKPGNILVTAAGVPKLLDFGIAKLLDAVPPEGGQTLGGMAWTPDYTSPEQVRAQRVTIRSDVYSLGLILYELLCQERGQKADTSSPLAMDQSICENEPALPSVRAAERGDSALAARLRGDLDAIVAMAIRKEPERRYESVAALNEDLRRYLDGEPVRARQGTLAYRTGKFVRRHWVPVTAGTVAAASLIVGAGVAILQAQRAERRFNDVRQLANTFLFDFHDRIATQPGLTETRAFVLNTATSYLDSLAAEAAGDPELLLELATAYQKVALVQGDPQNANLGQVEQARESHKKAVALASQLLESEPANRAALRLQIASHARLGQLEFWTDGKREEGMETFRRGLAVLDRLEAGGLRELAEFEAAMALLDRMINALTDTNPTEALTYAERAARTAEEGYQLTKQPSLRGALSNVYIDQFRILRSLADPARAEQAMQRSLTVAREVLAEDRHSTVAQNSISARLAEFSSLYSDPNEFHLNQPAKALELLQEAERILAGMVAADASNMQAKANHIRAKAALSHAYLSLDPRESLRIAKEAVAEAEERIAARPNAMGWRTLHRMALSNLGRACETAGDPACAMSAFSKSLAVSEAIVARSPNDLGALESRVQNETDVARVNVSLRRFGAAGEFLNRATAHVDELLKKYPRDLYFLRDAAIIAETRGDLALAEGRLAEAAESYRQALARWDSWVGAAREGPFPAWNRERVKAKAARSINSAKV